MLVTSGRSTSVNTAPKPVVRAGVALPGTKKRTSTMLLPNPVNSRGALKVVNKLGYVGLISLNSGGAPTAGFPLTLKPAAGPLNTAPRARPGVLPLKKSAGRLFGAERASGTPSQLISRRPLPTEPGRFGLRLPRSARNASTAGSMSAGANPAAKYV